MGNYAEIVQAINNLAKPRQFDYLTLGVAFLSIVISGIAIFVAIQVPNKIAKHQNKIALFEKRYEVYNKLLQFTAIVDVWETTFKIKNIDIKNLIEPINSLSELLGNSNVYNMLINISLELCQFKYLFGEQNQELKDYLQSEIDICMTLVHEDEIKDEIVDKIKELIKKKEKCTELLKHYKPFLTL
ncbi:MAG: hypothetical protein LKJ25_02130 [Clostridia bacterium]|jgi:predicted DNA-binding protein YlxM (UPF0122 family)|nr:hypothetical protein [Clostridia bacterium]